MTTLDELRQGMRAICDRAATEGRALTAAEAARLDRLAGAVAEEVVKQRRTDKRKAKRIAAGGVWQE